jgi:WW domain
VVVCVIGGVGLGLVIYAVIPYLCPVWCGKSKGMSAAEGAGADDNMELQYGDIDGYGSRNDDAFASRSRQGGGGDGLIGRQRAAERPVDPTLEDNHFYDQRQRRQMRGEGSKGKGKGKKGDAKSRDTTTNPMVLPLPSKDWGEYRDDKGDVYYFNTKTGESSWERPV